MDANELRTIAEQEAQTDMDTMASIIAAINEKDLRKTLEMISSKSKIVGGNQGLNELEIVQFAIDIFLICFEQTNVNPEMRPKMAKSFQDKLYQYMNVQKPTSEIPVTPEKSVISTSAPGKPSNYPLTPAPSRPTAITPTPVPMTSNPLTFSSDSTEDKFRSIAEQSGLGDLAFMGAVTSAINEKDLRKTMELIASKATTTAQEQGLSDVETVKLAFQYFMINFEQTNIPPETKVKMSASFETKLWDFFKIAKPQELIESVPIRTSAAPIRTMPAPVPVPTPAPKPTIAVPTPTPSTSPSSPNIFKRPIISSNNPSVASSLSSSSNVFAKPSQQNNPSKSEIKPETSASGPKDSKDMVIENLRNQLEEYKKKISESSYETLTTKISDLETQLAEKIKQIEDLKASSNLGGGSSLDINDLRTKMIVLQSKIRAGESKIQELTNQNEELEAKCKRNETKAGDSEQAEVLKRQLKQEMDTTENLRNQINQMQSGMSSQSQQEIQDLRKQLSKAQIQAGQGGSSASSAEINRLRQEITVRDQKIADLEKGGSSANLTGPMANVRLQREVNALKAQIDMLKRNEADMRTKYESAMRKSEQKEEEW
jgi:hypothetical protein